MNKLLVLFLILISCNGPEKVETPEITEPKQKVQGTYEKPIFQDTFQLDQNGVNALSGGNFGIFNADKSRISINNKPLEIDVWNDFIITFFVNSEVPETGIIKLERSDGKIKEIPYKKSNNITLYDKLVMVDDPEYDENGDRVDYWETKNEIIFRAINNYDSLKLIYPEKRKLVFNEIDENGRNLDEIPKKEFDENYEQLWRGSMIEPKLIGNTVYCGIEDYSLSGTHADIREITIHAYDNNASKHLADEEVIVSVSWEEIYEYYENGDVNYDSEPKTVYYADGIFQGLYEGALLFQTESVTMGDYSSLSLASYYDEIEITSKITKIGSNGFEYFETLEEALGEKNE